MTLTKTLKPLALLAALVLGIHAAPAAASPVGQGTFDQLKVCKDRTASSDVTVGKDDAHVCGTLEVDGATRLDGDLTMNGTGYFEGLGVNKTTIESSVNLDVAGAAAFGAGATRSTFTITGALTLPDGAAVAIGSAPASNADLVVGNGGNPTLFVDDGNAQVGIGTDAPASGAELNVYSTVDTIIEVTSDGSAGDDAILKLEPGGASAGDPYINFSVSGVGSKWIGVDNDDGDSVKIASTSFASDATLFAEWDSNGAMIFKPYTIGDLEGLAPTKAGTMVYCSDCTPAEPVISTGTSADQWALFSDPTKGAE